VLLLLHQVFQAGQDGAIPWRQLKLCHLLKSEPSNASAFLVINGEYVRSGLDTVIRNVKRLSLDARQSSGAL